MIRAHRGATGWSLRALALLGGLVAAAQFLPAAPAEDTPSAEPGKLALHARRRVETSPGSGRFHAITEPVEWDAAKTAIIICDMWDKHWCQGASRRVAAMAGRMNEVVAAARARGVLVIHCPSDTMEFYEGTPARKLAQQAPPAETKRPLERSCRLDAEREGRLPIDDSDGGCDCVPQCKNYKAWSRQIAAIEIAPGDAVTDSAEAYYLMRSRGIENAIVMGVHTNMCVLGRPFSIRQLVYQGMNVVLVRDLTDTMYNPRREPFVHHATGTDLVVEHIEKHWCPTVTSADFLGGDEFRFPEDKRPTVALLIAEDEYKTERSLPEFAAGHLGKEFRTILLFGSDRERNDIPGIDALPAADVLLVSARRRALPKSQLDLVRKFIEAGKPVVGIRTASHAFALRPGETVPEGHDVWTTFDPDVLGGHYTGHHGAGPKVAVSVASGAGDHPILAGIDVAQLTSWGSLYQVSPLGLAARPVLIGAVPDHPEEPIAWTNTNPYGGRVFYTSMGHIEDFTQPAFNRLLVNALRWVLHRPTDPRVE